MRPGTEAEREALRSLLADLWGRAKAGDDAAVAALVERYHWLPTKIARQKRVPPHFERDDVVAWANAGLFDAVRKFQPDSGDGQLHEHFIGYATLRVHGAILDGMKAPGHSWATRDAWRRVRAMKAADEELGHELGRPPTRTELATRLGVPVSDLPNLQQQVSLEAPLGDGDERGVPDILPAATESTDSIAEIQDIASRLAAKLVELPGEHRELAGALYFHGREVREVAEETGAPLGRVRRLRAELLLHLRDLLQHA